MKNVFLFESLTPSPDHSPKSVTIAAGLAGVGGQGGRGRGRRLKMVTTGERSVGERREVLSQAFLHNSHMPF